MIFRKGLYFWHVFKSGNQMADHRKLQQIKRLFPSAKSLLFATAFTAGIFGGGRLVAQDKIPASSSSIIDTASMVRLERGIFMSKDAKKLAVTFTDGRWETIDLTRNIMPDGKTSYYEVLGNPKSYSIKIIENYEIGTKVAVFISDTYGAYSIILSSTSDYMVRLLPMDSKCMMVFAQYKEWIIALGERSEFTLFSCISKEVLRAKLKNMFQKNMRLTDPKVETIEDETGALFFEISCNGIFDHVRIPMGENQNKKK